jgi:tRNA pseudouridine55 synthase
MRAPGTASPPRRRVDGVLLLDKAVGLSSNAALQQVKRLFRAEKAGHTGTLDPLASGLLPICFGEATKFAHMLLEADKTYVATVRLGVTTTTGDAEGEVLERRDVAVTRREVEAMLPRFVGRIAQVPPRYAALKYQGRNYYEYAREGVEIPRPAREVVVESLALDGWAPPDFGLAIRCGKGTYVRVLAEDLGSALGCGAHLAALRRIETGGQTLAAGCTLETLATLNEDERDARLLPPDTLVARLPRIDLEPIEAMRFAQGQAVARAGIPDATYRVYAADVFCGIALAIDGALRPRRLTAAAPSGSAAEGTRVPIESLES